MVEKSGCWYLESNASRMYNAFINNWMTIASDGTDTVSIPSGSIKSVSIQYSTGLVSIAEESVSIIASKCLKFRCVPIFPIEYFGIDLTEYHQ